MCIPMHSIFDSTTYFINSAYLYVNDIVLWIDYHIHVPTDGFVRIQLQSTSRNILILIYRN